MKEGQKWLMPWGDGTVITIGKKQAKGWWWISYCNEEGVLIDGEAMTEKVILEQGKLVV